MKSLVLLAFAAIGPLAPFIPAQTAAIRTVYVLPMAGGFDQHLADRITRDHVYQIVTDPRTADAFLTDRIGTSFEQAMAVLFPPPAPEEDEKDKKEAGRVTPTARGGLKSTGSRGTLFLVEAKSRQVVWTDFEKPVDKTPVALDREAERVTRKLAGFTGKAVK